MVLILSWNVAGLSTVIPRLSDHKSSTCLANYFQQHSADIVCLQEHKIPRSVLENRSDRRLVPDDAYESFWSIDGNKRGFNGVVTYCRKHSVTKAVVPKFPNDLQGRCVQTDHGSFVLFNVYAPCTSSTDALIKKLKFLRILRQHMREARTHKPVILVGDLNISYSKYDVHWGDRTFCIDDILSEVARTPPNESNQLPTWKQQVATHWKTIETILQTKTVVETVTTNSRTGEKYNKMRLCVSVDGRRVFLGQHETSADYCTYQYDFDPWAYYDEESQQEVPLGQPNRVRVRILAELMKKLIQIDWDESTQRTIAEAASVDPDTPSRKWFHSLLEEDGMVDAFRHFYPTAEGRFTCWNQNKNKRYSNEGTRIDYTLIDATLLCHMKQGDVTGPRCGHGVAVGQELTAGAAMTACTANGRYQPASFEGGGMVEASREALEAQFGTPHTGMVYTPPTYSDHIGVSLLLEDDLLKEQALLSNSATKASQPHKKQRSIASFFQKANGAVKPAATASTLPKTKRRKKNKPNTLIDHFRKMEKASSSQLNKSSDAHECTKQEVSSVENSLT